VYQGLPYSERIKPIGFYPLPSQPAQVTEFREVLSQQPAPPQATGNLLYLHIPFCHQRCSFCFFFENLYRDDSWQRYFAALKNNLRLLANESFIKGVRIDAIFFGGGSPNVFSEQELDEVLNCISSGFNLHERCEITLEWYPTNISRPKLQTAYNAGVTRLSFGVQSLDTELSQLLRLTHTPEQSREIVETALDVGFENINVDLLTGLPGETDEQLLKQLALAHSFGGGAISANPLEYIPSTPLQILAERGRMPETTALENKLKTIRLTNQALRDYGYLQQRFYNFHLPGKKHLYNDLSSRPFCNIVAAGLGAYGMINNYVYVNHKELEPYFSALERGELPAMTGNLVSPHELKRGYVVTSLLEMQLRPAEYMNAFGARLEDDFGDVIDEQLERGLIRKVEPDLYVLTDLGALWGDNVCSQYYSQEQADLLGLRFPKINKKSYGYHYAPAVQPH
jgi:oxygen-independent coproporphyrinogen-3 oxidase